jgi:hypothetical protein
MDEKWYEYSAVQLTSYFDTSRRFQLKAQITFNTIIERFISPPNSVILNADNNR